MTQAYLNSYIEANYDTNKITLQRFNNVVANLVITKDNITYNNIIVMQDNDDNLLTDINLNSDKFYSYLTDVLIFSIIEVIAEKLNLV